MVQTTQNFEFVKKKKKKVPFWKSFFFFFFFFFNETIKMMLNYELKDFHLSLFQKS